MSGFLKKVIRLKKGEIKMLLNQVVLSILYNPNGQFWIKTDQGIFKFPELSMSDVHCGGQLQSTELVEHSGTRILDIRKDESNVMIKLSDGAIILYSFNFDPASGEVHPNVDVQSAGEANQWEREFLQYPSFY
jgi:ligand-binding sensor domain-containing protein